MLLIGSLGRFRRGGKASFETAVTSLWGPEFSSITVRLRNPCERSLKIADYTYYIDVLTRMVRVRRAAYEHYPYITNA